MSEAPHHPDEHAATRRGIRWDALAAIIASLVGLLALIVAGYTAYMQRQQVRAQVWPYLEMGSSNGGGHYELAALNKGVGPLIVRNVQVLVAGKRVTDWTQLQRAIGFQPAGPVVHSTLNKTVLAPGDVVNWIVFQNAEDINAFRVAWAKFHVEARVCYVSTLGESWLTVYHVSWPGGFRPRPVAACPQVPDADQFND